MNSIMELTFSMNYDNSIPIEENEKDVQQLFNIELNDQKKMIDDLNNMTFGTLIFQKYLPKGNIKMKVFSKEKDNKKSDVYCYSIVLIVEDESKYKDLILLIHQIIEKNRKSRNKTKENKLNCHIDPTVNLYPTEEIDNVNEICYKAIYHPPLSASFFKEIVVKLALSFIFLALAFHFFSNKSDFLFNLVITILGTIVGLIPSKIPFPSLEITVQETMNKTLENKSRGQELGESFTTNKPEELFRRRK